METDDQPPNNAQHIRDSDTNNCAAESESESGVVHATETEIDAKHVESVASSSSSQLVNEALTAESSEQIDDENRCEVVEVPKIDVESSDQPSDVRPAHDDDDFGDFEDFTSFTGVTSTETFGFDAPTSSEADNGADWAAFGDTDAQPTMTDDVQADDWAASDSWSQTQADVQGSSQAQTSSLLSIAHLSSSLDSFCDTLLNSNVVDENNRFSDSTRTADAKNEKKASDLLSVIHELRCRGRVRALSSKHDDGHVDDANDKLKADNDENEMDCVNSCDRPSSADLWRRLRLIDEAISLTFTWNSASMYLMLLDSLGVDLQLAQLSRSSLPAFAPHLSDSVLVPQPAVSATSPTTAGASTRSKTKPERNGATPRNVSHNTNNNVKSQSSQLSTKQPAAKGSTNSDQLNSLAVPPAQFDWTNSGLNNPLTGQGVSTASNMLDLDFLAMNDTSNKNSLTAALQRDFDALGLTPTPTSGSNTQRKNEKPSLVTKPQKYEGLDELLSSSGVQQQTDVSPMTSGQSATTSTSGILSVSALSAEARSLHDRLPNLEHMMSANLVFPIKNQSNATTQQRSGAGADAEDG